MRTPMNQINECNQNTLSCIHQIFSFQIRVYRTIRYSPHYKILCNMQEEISAQTLSTAARKPTIPNLAEKLFLKNGVSQSLVEKQILI